MHIYALKNIVKVGKAGHLSHGSTFSFFRKEVAEFYDTYNINFMPPLVLQNCLPEPLEISFVDSNKRLTKLLIEKEMT